jgi:hypothetical protein
MDRASSAYLNFLRRTFMRTCFLLLIAGGAISLWPLGCGGKLTNAETLEDLEDGSILAGGTTTGSGGAANGGGTSGAAGSSGTGTGSGGGGTGDPDPDPGGTGGTGSGNGAGTIADASSQCPASRPSNGGECAAASSVCSYGATTCACTNEGGRGGNRRDAGTTWTCGVDAGRGGGFR